MENAVPTPERLAKAQGDVAIGDDQQGRKRYTFYDSALDRVYGPLVRAATTDDETNRLRIEYAALVNYYRVYVKSGMIGSIGSVDLDRLHTSTPSGRTFLANTERQLAAGHAYYRARIALKGDPLTVVELVVCNDASLETAGYEIGKKSKRRAIVAARKTLRDAGYRLAELWGMVRV